MVATVALCNDQRGGLFSYYAKSIRETKSFTLRRLQATLLYWV